MTTWVAMAATQAALFALHPMLDHLLDPGTKEVVEPDRFYGLHRIYLIVTTLQWAAALAHLWANLGAAGVPEKDSSREA